MASRAGIDADIVLQKAVEIINRDGYEGLSMGKLAEALSVRPPSLYNHIGGLFELKQRLAVFGCGKLYEQMVGAAIGLSGNEAVYSLSLAYIHFARQQPGLYAATFHAPDLHVPELREAQGKIVQIVVQVMAAYKLDEETTLHMVRGLRSMLHGFISIEQAGGFGLPLNLDESFHMMIKTFLKGLSIKKSKKH